MRGPASALRGRTLHCGRAQGLKRSRREAGRVRACRSSTLTSADSTLSRSLLTHTASKGDTGSDALFLPSWKICQLGIQCVIKQTTGMLHTVNYRVKPTAKTADEQMKTFWCTEHVRCCELQRLACGPGEGQLLTPRTASGSPQSTCPTADTLTEQELKYSLSASQNTTTFNRQSLCPGSSLPITFHTFFPQVFTYTV